MRVTLTLIMIVLVIAVKAQAPFAGNFQNNNYRSNFTPLAGHDSGQQSKWSLNRFTGITTGYTFFRHGGAGFIAAPMGLQLNRKLTNNLYAFAGVNVAPMYINFNRTFLNTDLNKVKTGGGFYQKGNFNINSAATLGLMYINNERTFSVSGSISVERNNDPFYYNYQLNTSRSNFITPAYR